LIAGINDSPDNQACGRFKKKEKGFMNEFRGAEHSDEAMLMLDLSDEALENAAGSVWEKRGAMTLAFYSAIEQVLASCSPSCRTVLRRLARRWPPGASSPFLAPIYFHLPRVRRVPPVWPFDNFISVEF